MLETAVKPVEAATLMLILSLMTACLGWFFQYTLKPGEIFGRYGLLLTALWMKNWRRKDRWVRPILKPLGQCVFCNSTWIAIVVYIIALFTLFGWQNTAFIPALTGLFLFTGLNYIWVKLLQKIAEHD